MNLPFLPEPNQPVGQPPVQIQHHQGRYFRFALPTGWTVNENTNLCCLNSPDNQAAIMTVGLVGMLQSFTPDQFVVYALQMHQMVQVNFLSGQPVAPPPGCVSAGVFELTYVTNGIPCRGIATSSVAIGYNQCNATLTLAAAQAASWDAYRAWLPQVAAEVAPVGPNTYMAATVAAQNLNNSLEFGQRLHEVNEYTQRLQQQTNNERWASQGRNNFAFRENLGNAATYTNPYENRIVELSANYTYYWVNRQGQVFGTNNPGDDPCVGSTEEWVPMQRYQP